MTVRDVAIIGGGLAGGAAAALLAQNGVDALLLEKEAQPHHKVCGEFMGPDALHYLAQLGVDPSLNGAQLIDRLHLARLRRTLALSLGFQPLSLSRRRLDDAVLTRAVSCGAEIRRGLTVTGLVPHGAHWQVICQGQGPIFARAVFLAIGKHDLTGWSHRVGRQDDFIGLKMHYRLAPDQQAQLARSVELVLFHGGYLGLAPVENGLANLCLVVTKSRFAACGKKWETLRQQLLLATPHLAARLAGAMPCWEKPLAIFGIPYGFMHCPSSQDSLALYRLGDQLAVIPSLFGEGMAIALHTACLAAACYLQSDAAVYHRRAVQQLSAQINSATRLSRLIAAPFLQPLVLPLCRLIPPLVPAAIRRTRIQGLLQ
jgi:flavin-dependent dehydrogenase